MVELNQTVSKQTDKAAERSVRRGDSRGRRQVVIFVIIQSEILISLNLEHTSKHCRVISSENKID